MHRIIIRAACRRWLSDQGNLMQVHVAELDIGPLISALGTFDRARHFLGALQTDHPAEYAGGGGAG